MSWTVSCAKCDRVLLQGTVADMYAFDASGAPAPKCPDCYPTDLNTAPFRCRCILILKETPVPDPERASPIPVRMFAAELQPGYVVPAGQLYDHNGAVIDEDLTITEVTKRPNGLLALHVKGPMSGGGVHVGPDLSLEVHPDALALSTLGHTELTGVAARVLGEVLNERKRQDVRWGKPADRRITHAEWLAVLIEEVGEVAKELNDSSAGRNLIFPEGSHPFDDHMFRVRLTEELVQVAAVAMAMAEAVHWANPDT